MKRRGRREISFRTPETDAAAYEKFQNDMLDPQPMPETERLRLYEVALQIREIQAEPVDLNPSRARAKRNELDDLLLGFSSDLVRYTGTDFYTWEEKNLTAKVSHIQIDRRTSPTPEFIWHVEFF